MSHPRAHDRCMTSATPFNDFDWLRLDTERRILQFGYTMLGIGYGSCAIPGCSCNEGPSAQPYAYSFGLWKHDHPEIVMFGVPMSHVNDVSNLVYNRLLDGDPLPVGREHLHRVPGGPLIALEHVPPGRIRRDPGRIAGWLDHFGQRVDRRPAMLQALWGDRDDVMPWEDGFDPEVAALQPLLVDDPINVPPRPRSSPQREPRRRRR